MEEKHLCKTKLVDQEYETQHFGFSTQTMVDAMRGVFMDTVKMAAESLASKITEHMKNSKPEDVRAATDQLVAEYETAMKNSLPKWEEAINRHFQVPSHVLLEEDEPQRQQFSAAEAAALDDELASLTRRAKRAVLMDSFLSRQLEVVGQIRQRLESCEARLGSEEATRTLRLQTQELCKIVRDFTSKTDALGKTESQCVPKKEPEVLRSRFQYLE